jgi:hypothetical protein
MTEEQAKCCGNCRWWYKYWLCKGGWCCLHESDRLPSDSCSQWEQHRDQDDHDEEEDDNDT